MEFEAQHVASGCVFFNTLDVPPLELIKNMGDMHDRLHDMIVSRQSEVPDTIRPIARDTFALIDQYAGCMNSFIHNLGLTDDKNGWMEYLQSYVDEGRISRLYEYASKYFDKYRSFMVAIDRQTLPAEVKEYKKIVEECFANPEEVLPRTMQEKINYIQTLKAMGPRVASPEVLRGKHCFRQLLESYLMGGDVFPYLYKGLVINVRTSEVDCLSACLEYCKMDLSELDNCVIDLDDFLKYYYAKSVLGKRV